MRDMKKEFEEVANELVEEWTNGSFSDEDALRADLERRIIEAMHMAYEA